MADRQMGKYMAKISVIMGVYNEENKEHVALAIRSVLNQTYSDFEFIICDDGSQFSFYQWLQEYCSKDERIILLRNEKNAGLAATLNRCLRHASGIYIARMDADDISEKTRFEKQVDFLNRHPQYALVGCNATMIDGGGAWGENLRLEIPQKTDFLHTSVFIHPSIMIRQEILEKLGGYEEGDWAKRTEDYELFMRLYAEGYFGYNMQERLLCYREDRKSYQKRKYRYRMNEFRVRYRGFKSMGILRGHLIYVIKPLIVGLIPSAIMPKFRRRKFGM